MKWFNKLGSFRLGIFLLPLLLAGCPFAGFDSYDDDDDDNYRRVVPVYMTYQTLRSSVSAENPVPLANVGRVYLYQDHLFLVNKNQGIHVFDNSDPENPKNIRFISIPGNTELSIKENNLYADSYVDLITIDLQNLPAISVIDREEDVFPWDAYQNVPSDTNFYSWDLDESKGVVIGYAYD